MSAGLVQFLFVAAGLFACGAFAVAYRRDLEAALAGVPLMLAGAGVAFVGAGRFAASAGDVLFGQEIAALLAVAALALGVLGLGIIGREGLR
jgi:NADH:ubiquinone oxidoreductase subunit K